MCKRYVICMMLLFAALPLLASAQSDFVRIDSVGRAPALNAPVGELGAGIAAITGTPAYALQVYPGTPGLRLFGAGSPGSWTTLGDLPASQYFAGDFSGNDFTKLYVIDYGLRELHSINTMTGAVQVIGPAIPFGSESWTGMTGGPDGTMYASSTSISRSTLYTIDLSHGTATVVGQITNANCIIDIAMNASGQMYGVDICIDSLVSIDPATGTGTVIGATGFDANFAQGMDFDDSTGTLYLAAYGVTGELRSVDLATGNTTLIGTFPGGAEVDCLAFAASPVYSGLVVLSPNGGNAVSAGSVYDIRWGAPPAAQRFTIKYSKDGGSTWKKLAVQYANTTFKWSVPLTTKNMKNWLIGVDAFDATGAYLGSDISDAKFTLEVVRVTSPNAGTFTAGAPMTVTWDTNATKRPVSSVKIFFSKNAGAKWSPMAIEVGNPGTSTFNAPAVTSSNCLVKVVLLDATNLPLGNDISDALFTVQP